jgi:hypothetical protein
MERAQRAVDVGQAVAVEVGAGAAVLVGRDRALEMGDQRERPVCVATPELASCRIVLG